ncbi:MAG: type IX secretion system sortase PorU, partial [Ignavibacteriaceae bacterium]|nr:type IX secretion system sortase PorU [Ignavibacteriaceae bacterium]
KRMQLQSSEPGPAGYVQNTTKAFAYLHQDLINIAQSGRYFVGDAFNSGSLSRTYTNLLDNLIPGSNINYTFNFVNSDPSSSDQLTVQENGNTLYNSFINGINSDVEDTAYSYGILTQASASFSGNIPNNRSLLKFTYNAVSPSSKGYLNWFEIYYNKALAPSNSNLIFFSKDTTAVIEYDLNSFSNNNISVYDITDYSNVKIISNPLLLNDSEFRFISTEKQGFVSKYLAVGSDSFMTPVNSLSAENSNIHGFQDGAKLIIISPKDFMDQALRLKSFKENHPKLNTSTYIADVAQVFDEFSCGMKDVSGIRNFIKYAFDNWTIKPQYVLLFGDGTYDYKNIEGSGNNYIIPWETVDIHNLIDSYPMDDFYVEVSGTDNIVDMGIGRLTINSESDARIAVDKIISYESDNSKGAWQNLITMVADDQWTSTVNEGNYHVAQSEDLANNHIPVSFDLNKIYLGEYPTVITGLGRTKPGVTEDLVKAINNGSIIVNFIGHGSPELWTHERVFENSTTIPRLINDKLFFLTAATCDFGYYDIPNTQSGAELLVMKDASGAIGSVTAARPVYSDQNSELNNQFYDDLLNVPRDSLNLPIPVGQAYFNMKVVRTGPNDQKYHLFCDPSLRLSIPQFNANIDSVNSQSLTSNVQIKALSNTRIKGRILKSDNLLWNTFNGQGILSVFDSQRQTTMTEQPGIIINLQGGIIFRGQISVTNGVFNSSFVVPKDISYENKNGKVVFLFYDNNSDGLGYTTNVIVGGTDSTAVNDKSGPKIDVYFDDASFKNGYLVNPDSKLIVKLSDPTGLNTTGTGIGHKIEGVLNDDVINPIDFTSYFTGDLDAGGKSGQVNYQFNNLNLGQYKLQVKAWDVFNNFSVETTYFDVVSGNSLTIGDVYNYPNPFSGKTTFTFQQNLNKTFDVKIKIYTVAGRLIKVIDSYSVRDKYVTIDWDGKDQDGSPIANGVYFYKLILKSTDDTFNQSVIGKLAVVR